MSTICKKCKHHKIYTAYSGIYSHQCSAVWGPQTIDQVTGGLKPASWDCAEKNPEDGPCPKYKKKTFSWVDVFLVAWALVACAFLYLVVFHPKWLP